MTKDKKPCEYWPLAPKTGYYNIGGKRVWLEAEDPFPEIAPRTWVDLTDEEIDYYIVHRLGIATKKNLVELIRLCEAKSKEKNT